MIYSLHSNCTLHSSLNSSLHKVTFYAMQDVDHWFHVEKNNDFIEIILKVLLLPSIVR